MASSHHTPPDMPRQSSEDEAGVSVHSSESADSVVRPAEDGQNVCQSEGERSASRSYEGAERRRRHDSLASSFVNSLWLSEGMPQAVSAGAVSVLVKVCLEELLPPVLESIRKEHRHFLESTFGEYRSREVCGRAELPQGEPPVMPIHSRTSRPSRSSPSLSRTEPDMLSDPSEVSRHLGKDAAYEETRGDGSPNLPKAPGVEDVQSTRANPYKDTKQGSGRRRRRLKSFSSQGVRGLELDVADAVLYERHLAGRSADSDQGPSDASASGAAHEAVHHTWRRLHSARSKGSNRSAVAVVPEPTPPEHNDEEEQKDCQVDTPSREWISISQDTTSAIETNDLRVLRRRYGSMSSNDLRLVRAEELTECVAPFGTQNSLQINPMCISTRTDQSLAPAPDMKQSYSVGSEEEWRVDGDATKIYYSPRGVVMVLRVCGVGKQNSCCARLCSTLMWLVTFAALGIQLYDMATNREDAIHIIADKDCPKCVWFRGTLGHCVVASTSVLSLAAVRHSGRKKAPATPASLQTACDMLTAYAHKHDFTNLWDEAWRRDARHALMLWLSASMVCLASFVYDTIVSHRKVDSLLMLQAVSVVFVHGLLHITNLSVLRVCRCMGLTVDVFCADVVSDKDLEAATTAWNLLQAVLLKASACIMAPFVTLVLSVAAAAPAFLADLYGFGDAGATVGLVVSMLPNLFMWYGIVRTALIASHVSESCSRVPALINCHFFGVGTEQARQLAVEFVANSGAGFYVSDVRLNSALIFKFLYMWSVVALGTGARILDGKNI